MLIQKGPIVVMQTQPLPDAITQHETAIINADDGLFLGDNFTVYVNQDFCVTRIFFGLVGGDVI